MTETEICNNALDLIGQGLHIEGMDENSKEAESCSRLFGPTLRRCLGKADWSFARKTAKLEETAGEGSQPFKYSYALPADCMRVLFIQPVANEDVTIHTYEQDLRFDFRTVNGERLLITSVPAPVWIQYDADITETELLPGGFTEWLEYCLAARLAADIIKGTEAIQISQALDTRADTLYRELRERDPKPELPLDAITADILSLTGQGLHDCPLEVQRKAVGYTSRRFREILNRVIAQHPWSFSRRSFTVDETGEGDAFFSRSFELPADAVKVLYIVPPDSETAGTDVLFDFRVTETRKVLTSLAPPFTVVYQGEVLNTDTVKPGVMEAVKLYAASDLIANFFKQRQTQQESRTEGVGNNDASLLREKADAILSDAWAADEPLRLPLDAITAAVCDIAGMQIDTQGLEAQKRIADFVARYWKQALGQALSSYNWSFATRDEYITEDSLTDITSLPFRYTYTIPEDVLRVLYISPECRNPMLETVGYPGYAPFNFRNHQGKVYLVTDLKAPFLMRYQCRTDDPSLLPPLLKQALTYLCAAQVVTSFNTEQPAQARNSADYFYQLGMMKMEQAAGRDAQQGGYSMKQQFPSRFTRARF